MIFINILSGDWAIFAYFYGPIAVLLIANCVTFGFTINHLMKHGKDTVNLRQNKKSAAVNRQRFILYVELFVVMGITWMAEVISWKVGQPEAWYIFDLLNALQGVFIFFIFVCKPKILRHLRDYFKRRRYCCCYSATPHRNASARRMMSNSSAGKNGSSSTNGRSSRINSATTATTNDGSRKCSANPTDIQLNVLSTSNNSENRLKPYSWKNQRHSIGNKSCTLYTIEQEAGSSGSDAKNQEIIDGHGFSKMKRCHCSAPSLDFNDFEESRNECKEN
jgi:hypothetical protein